MTKEAMQTDNIVTARGQRPGARSNPRRKLVSQPTKREQVLRASSGMAKWW